MANVLIYLTNHAILSAPILEKWYNVFHKALILDPHVSNLHKQGMHCTLSMLKDRWRNKSHLSFRHISVLLVLNLSKILL